MSPPQEIPSLAELAEREGMSADEMARIVNAVAESYAPEKTYPMMNRREARRAGVRLGRYRQPSHLQRAAATNDPTPTLKRTERLAKESE